MTEVLWWYSTRAGTAHQRIRHSSRSLPSSKRLLRANNIVGRVIFTIAGDPDLRWLIPHCAKSNNYQGIVDTCRDVVVRSGTSPSCCGSIDRNHTLSGMLPFSDLEPFSRFYRPDISAVHTTSTLSTYYFRLSCDPHRLSSMRS